MRIPTVTIEFFSYGKDDPTPYRAHIVGEGFDHHGMAPSPSEALLLAAAHWHSYEGSKEPDHG